MPDRDIPFQCRRTGEGRMSLEAEWALRSVRELEDPVRTTVTIERSTRDLFQAHAKEFSRVSGRKVAEGAVVEAAIDLLFALADAVANEGGAAEGATEASGVASEH
jgi:hypothetical protein